MIFAVNIKQKLQGEEVYRFMVISVQKKNKNCKKLIWSHPRSFNAERREGACAWSKLKCLSSRRVLGKPMALCWQWWELRSTGASNLISCPHFLLILQVQQSTAALIVVYLRYLRTHCLYSSYINCDRCFISAFFESTSL